MSGPKVSGEPREVIRAATSIICYQRDEIEERQTRGLAAPFEARVAVGLNQLVRPLTYCATEYDVGCRANGFGSRLQKLIEILLRAPHRLDLALDAVVERNRQRHRPDTPSNDSGNPPPA